MDGDANGPIKRDMTLKRNEDMLQASAPECVKRCINREDTDGEIQLRCSSLYCRFRIMSYCGVRSRTICPNDNPFMLTAAKIYSQITVQAPDRPVYQMTIIPTELCVRLLWRNNRGAKWLVDHVTSVGDISRRESIILKV